MREKLSSRLGFLMLAAGSAVGLGNVWRFPFVVGQNGGAAFVLVYLFFLALLGFPMLTAELALGRASRQGISGAMRRLAEERYRRFWSVAGRVIFAGNFLLMIYYTDVAGWLLKYSGDYLRGLPPPDFSALLKDHATCSGYLFLTITIATIVCALGVKNGVERVTKWMMLALLALLGVLAVKALSLPGAEKGLKFYLAPDWSRFAAHPWKSVFDAMGQAFFTLSLGIGSMAIFGSAFNAIYLLPKFSQLYGLPMDAIIGLGTMINGGITNVTSFVTLAVAPLNLIKGAMISILTVLLYKKVARPLFGRSA